MCCGEIEILEEPVSVQMKMDRKCGFRNFWKDVREEKGKGIRWRGGRKAKEDVGRVSRIWKGERAFMETIPKVCASVGSFLLLPWLERGALEDFVLEIGYGSRWPVTSQSFKPRPSALIVSLCLLPMASHLFSALSPLLSPRLGHQSRTDLHFPQVHTVHTD